MDEQGSAGVGTASASLRLPMAVAEYLHKVQERLTRESDDGWLLSIETHVEYTFDGNGTVERKGGSFLISKAHGRIAELEIGIDYDTDHEMVTNVEPGGQITWNIAKVLMLR